MLMMINEFEEMNNITSLLASVLNFPAAKGMPEDVTEAVRAAKKQMEDLPSVIDDLNMAFQRYTALAGAISRMTELAGRAGAYGNTLTEDDRASMDSEFGQLAGVIAAEAGHQQFAGTSLSLLSDASASAASKVLAYLAPAVENLGHEIRGQKSLILQAIVETANFLGIVASCYPQAQGIEELKNALEMINLPRNINDPVSINPTLH